MQKFYFFYTLRERNAQGEFWMVVKPFAGQTTYENNREVDVRADLKVQLPVGENRKAVRLPAGSILGVKYTGSSKSSVALTLRRRGEVYYYRTDQELFLVSVEGALGAPNLIQRADDEMIGAFRELTGRSVNEQSTPHNEESTLRNEESPAATTSATSTAADGAGNDDDEIADVVRTRVDNFALRNIEGHLSDCNDERETLAKLLLISKINDRCRCGVAKFSFRKQNGDVRIAYGTRNAEVIAMFQQDGGGNEEERRNNGDGGHFHYFDIQRQAWRCFCTEDVLSVTGDVIRSKAVIRAIANS